MASGRILATLKLCALAVVVAASMLWPKGETAIAAGAMTVAAGCSHTCAVTTDDHVQCWGRTASIRWGMERTRGLLYPWRYAQTRAAKVVSPVS